MKVLYSLLGYFTRVLKCLNTFLKVNITNPIQLVAVATVYYVNYINLFIYICTQSLLKSLDNKALQIVPF
jgi:hypothetical protein